LSLSGAQELAHARNARQSDAPSFGVWRWSNQDIETQRLIEFAAGHGVNEIYWSAGFTTPRWCEETATELLTAAHKNGIAVYYLTGDWSWIHRDDGFIARMEAFRAWQASTCEATRFAGIHLDVEPHQDPDWRDGDAVTRNRLLQSYIDFKVQATDRFGSMDWSIPFWWSTQDYTRIMYRGETIYLYRAAILEANRVFVMSYRNTAQATYDIAEHHVRFAQEVGRPIFLSALAQCGAEDPAHDHVYYSHLGYEYMMRELKALRELVDDPSVGIAIHEIVGWYQMWREDVEAHNVSLVKRGGNRADKLS